MLLNRQVWFSSFGIAIRERGEDAGMGVNQKAVMGGHGLPFIYFHHTDKDFLHFLINKSTPFNVYAKLFIITHRWLFTRMAPININKYI